MTATRTTLLRLAVLFTLGLALCAPFFAEAAPPEVTVTEQGVTLDGGGAPLETVLAALASKADLALELRGRLTEPWSQSLRNLTLAQALNRLLGPGGHAYVLRTRPDPTSGSPRRVLTVISAAPAEPGDTLVVATPAPEAKAPETTTAGSLDSQDLAEAQALLEGVLESEATEDERAAALEALQEIESLAQPR